MYQIGKNNQATTETVATTTETMTETAKGKSENEVSVVAKCIDTDGNDISGQDTIQIQDAADFAADKDSPVIAGYTFVKAQISQNDTDTVITKIEVSTDAENKKTYTAVIDEDNSMVLTADTTVDLIYRKNEEKPAEKTVSITTTCVDTEGKAITGHDGKIESTTDLTEANAPKIDGYTYEKAKIAKDGSDKTVTKIEETEKDGVKTYTAVCADGSIELSEDATVSFIYKKNESDSDIKVTTKCVDLKGKVIADTKTGTIAETTSFSTSTVERVSRYIFKKAVIGDDIITKVEVTDGDSGKKYTAYTDKDEKISLSKDTVISLVYRPQMIMRAVTPENKVDLSKNNILINETGTSYKTYFKIGSNTLSLGGDDQTVVINDQDKVELALSWGMGSNNAYDSDTEFYYDLPSIIDWPSASGDIKQDGEVIGRYSLSNNKVVANFTTDFLAGGNKKCGLLFDGTVTQTKYDDASSKVYSFPGIGTIKPTADSGIDKSDLSVNKSTSTDSIDKLENQAKISGLHHMDYSILITSKGTNKDVYVKDTITSGIGKAENFKVYKGSSASGTELTAGTGYSVTDSSATGFKLTLPDMANGDQYYVTYDCPISDADYKKIISSTDGLVTKNRIDIYKGTSDSLNHNDCDRTFKRSCDDVVNKSGSTSEDGKTITWKIEINKNHYDLNGMTIKDVLGTSPVQTYVTNSYKLWKAAKGSDFPKNTDIPEANDNELPYASLSSSSGYTFSSENTNAYYIEYQTTATPNESGQTSYENDVVCNGLYPGKKQGWAGYNPGDYIPKANKWKVNGWSTSGGTLGWGMQVVMPSSGTLTDIVLHDVYGDGLVVPTTPPTLTIKNGNATLVQGTKDSHASSDYWVECTANGFDVHFVDGKLSNGQTYTVSDYSTTCKNPVSSSYKYTNEAYVTCSNGESSHNKQDYGQVGFKLSKNCTEENGEYKWTLTVDPYAGNSRAGFVIEDSMSVDPANGGSMTFDNAYNSSKGFSALCNGNDVTANISLTGNCTPKFTINTDSDSSQPITITYCTKKTYDANGTQVNYKNDAVLKDGSSNQLTTTSKTMSETHTVLKKEHIYDNDNAPYVDFSIDVNADAIDLDNAKDKLTLIDTMESNLLYVSDTEHKIKVLDVANGNADITDTSCTVNPVVGKDGKTTITVTVPDSKHLKIVYQPKVKVPVGTTITNAGNTIKADWTTTISSDDQELNNKTSLSGKAFGDNKSIKINLTKQDSSNHSNLSGARFKFTSYILDKNGSQYSLKAADASENKETTGTLTDGLAAYKNASTGRVIKVEESQAPNGYEKSDEALYYAFPGTWDRNIAQTETEFSGVKIPGTDTTLYTSGANKNLTFVTDCDPVSTTVLNTKKQDIALTLHKVDKDDTQKSLSGAVIQFTSYKVNRGSSNTLSKINDESGSKTTGTDGNADYTGIRGRVIKVTETSAPSGYSKSDAVKYFVFFTTDQTKTDYAGLTDPESSKTLTDASGEPVSGIDLVYEADSKTEDTYELKNEKTTTTTTTTTSTTTKSTTGSTTGNTTNSSSSSSTTSSSTTLTTSKTTKTTSTSLTTTTTTSKPDTPKYFDIHHNPVNPDTFNGEVLGADGRKVRGAKRGYDVLGNRRTGSGTGDDTPMWPIAVLIFSAAAMAAVIETKRRNDKKQ